MHFIKSGAWLDELLLDDCPGMDLTVEMLGIDDRPGFMIFSPKSDCVVSGAEEAALLLERCGLAVTRHVRNGDRAGAGQPLLEARGNAAGLHRGWKISQTLMEYMSGIATRAARMAGHADQPGQLPVGRDPSCGNLCDDAPDLGVEIGGNLHRLFRLSETAGAESGAQVRPLPPESRFLDGPGQRVSAAAHPAPAVPAAPAAPAAPEKGVLSS